MKNILGKILQEYLQMEGSPSVKDFAKMMGLSARTVYNIFDGTSSMTFEQVVKASEILNYDITDEYYRRLGKAKSNSGVEESSSEYRYAKNTISTTLTISGTFSTFENFPALLNKIREATTEYGFEIA